MLLNMLKPSRECLQTFQSGASFMDQFHVYLCYAVLSVPCSPVITCGERADLLVLLCAVFSCVLSLSHYMVLRVRYDT